MNIINGKVYDGDGEDITGDVGLVISGKGPVHLGDGDVYTNTVVISGPGVTIVQGNSSGISKSFGSERKK
jgi:hypothetical protein